jgi:hypothetical protein
MWNACCSAPVMRNLHTLLVATVSSLVSGACQPALDEARRIVLDDDLAGRQLIGLSSDPEPGILRVLSADEGYARVSSDGAFIDENRYGSNGLLRDAYQDLAVDDDGTVYLIADNEGFRFHPQNLVFEQHFCILPGDDVNAGPIPGTPPQRWQENDALTLVDGTLIAAPRFFEEGTTGPVQALLSSYRASDGEPTGVANITEHGLDIRALAATATDIYALSARDLHVFSRQGLHRGMVHLALLNDPLAMTLVGDELVFVDGDELVFVERGLVHETIGAL